MRHWLEKEKFKGGTGVAKQMLEWNVCLGMFNWLFVLYEALQLQLHGDSSENPRNAIHLITFVAFVVVVAIAVTVVGVWRCFFFPIVICLRWKLFGNGKLEF